MKILRLFISLLFITVVLFEAKGQQEIRTYGLRIGYDLSRLPLNFMNPKRTGMEFSADCETVKNLYPVFEIGQGKMTLDKPSYQYSSNGLYMRFGADYNILKPVLQNQYDMVFIGIRYSHCTQHYSNDNIYITDKYWGDFSGNLPEKTIQVHWIELAGGLRTEVFRNFFIGWSLRGRFMIYKTKDPHMDPFFIPGYGKGDKKSVFGINWSVYYKVPAFKRKVKITKAD